MSKKIEIIKELKKLLFENFSGKIKDVILFGSQAYDDENRNSDYDILIILNEDYNYNNEKEIIDLCYEIDLQYQILTDVHILSINELNSIRGKQPVFQNAIEFGIYA